MRLNAGIVLCSMFSFLRLLLAAIPCHVWISSLNASAVVTAKPAGLTVGSCQGRQLNRYKFFTPTITFITPEIPRQVAQKVHPSVALLSPIVGVRNMTSQGSGFVVELLEDNEGLSSKTKFDAYVLTAAHVASPGKRIQVSFPYQTNNTYSYSASVLARDWRTDLALLGLTSPISSSEGVEGDEKYPLLPPPLSLRKNEFIHIGELAFANGYPAGFDGIAMTSGIVCGTAKDVFGKQEMRRSGQNQILESKQNQIAGEEDKKTACCYVVTDAAMAGGMSGGPLVDVNGAVIGMNSLLRPDLGPLGNYAVNVGECHEFLSMVSSRNALTSNPNESLHQVVIFNDPMNTRARVAKVLQEIAKINATQAEECMLQAHNEGWAIVQTFLKKSDAERLCTAIQNEDILAELRLESFSV